MCVHSQAEYLMPSEVPDYVEDGERAKVIGLKGKARIKIGKHRLLAVHRKEKHPIEAYRLRDGTITFKLVE